MLSIPTTPRQVGEAFAVAERMKKLPFDALAFRSRLAEERDQVSRLSDAELNSNAEVHDHHRRERIARGTWHLQVVELSQCQTWPGFGGRKWAKPLLVPRMAEAIKAKKDDPLWSRAPESIRLTFSELPLILTVKQQGLYHFDDGCHRAVLYWLYGLRQAFAFVGRIPPELNHQWDPPS